MDKTKKLALIFSYILLSGIALIFGIGTFSNIYEKGNVSKCGTPSKEQMTHVLTHCPDEEGLKCTVSTSSQPCKNEEIEENGKCNLYGWRFCNSDWKSILECPPITREEIDTTMDSFGEDWCNRIICHQGKWKPACVHFEW